MPKTRIILPHLFSRTKDGRFRYYVLEVVHLKGQSNIIRTKAVNLNGKTQIDTTEVFEGVNIGKANETTRTQQAIAMAESMHKSLKDDGYKTLSDMGITISDEEAWADISRLDVLLSSGLPMYNTDAKGNPKPMLAKSYVKEKQEFPAFVQPKLDGVRCLAICKSDHEVILLSRNGKQYFHPELEKDLLGFMEVGQILDGELYTHKEITFQDIISAIKRKNTEHPNLPKIKFHVYDVAVADLTFEERTEMVAELQEWENCHMKGYVQQVPTVIVHSQEELDKEYNYWMDEGYEGVMVRDFDGMYEFGNRSSKLKKVKEMLDEEFTILGVYEATGRDKGTAILEINVKTKAGDWTTVKPQGTQAQRAKMWNERHKLIGKKVTIQFQGYTDEGSLRFPSAKAIRDYE